MKISKDLSLREKLGSKRKFSVKVTFDKYRCPPKVKEIRDFIREEAYGES
jgi:hypothetical protein